jgi:uncharacterized protein (UPF0261 family)
MKRKEKTQVLVVATMDTKGEEAAYLATCLEKLGLKPLIMDPGIRGNPDLPVFVSRQEVAARGGTTLGEVQSIPHEGRALNAMIVGAVKVSAELYEQGAIKGVVSIGGSMGTTLGSSVMRALPFGFPKVMISTMASRNTRAFVGTRDILMLHSVCDLAGLNRMTRKVFENGAGALAGMVNSGLMESENERPRRQIALSTLGTTEACAAWLRQVLSEEGFEVVTFHTNGSGGQAMEEMITEGAFDALIDLSLHEMVDHVHGGDYDAGAQRGTAALRLGIPTVLVPGNMDFLVTGPLEDAKKRFPGRRYHSHNEAITVAQVRPEEMAEMAYRLADLCSGAKGPVAVVIPAEGFSAFGHPKGPFYEPSNPKAFINAFGEKIHDKGVFRTVQTHVNDETFAVAVLEAFKSIMH